LQLDHENNLVNIRGVRVDNLWRELAPELVGLIATFRSKLSTLNISTKADRTLLTDADMALQDLIVERIAKFDPDAYIIAEEADQHLRRPDGTSSGAVWIVDPIDGTAQFVEPESVEFCCVVARYVEGMPQAALVVAPELGPARTPIVISVVPGDACVEVNGQRIGRRAGALGGRASTTRSQSNPPSDVERNLVDLGYTVKTRTTSQTLDMVRTAVDLIPFCAHMPPFDLFHRRNQKLWDGAAGLCFAMVVGLAMVDEFGNELLPLSPTLLGMPEPVLRSSVVGERALVKRILGEV
jgi:3'(2'), 5'-bisphosphate nucleotidase